ncbi:MAG: baseplate J/gp47 family protein [Brevundimonas sp.]
MAITRYEPPSIADLRDRACNDVRRGKQLVGIAKPNVAPGSEVWVRFDALSSLVFELHAKNAALQDATMPDKATGDDLLRLCAIRGILPSKGAGAQGNGIADCIGYCTYPANLECTDQAGIRYTVVSSVYATAGDPIPLVGADVGKRTDKPVGTVLTWTSPPAGSAATVKVGPGGLTNGTDADNDSSMRRKLYDRLRHPGQSGSWAHYVQWAEGNAGVEKAFDFPALRGPSTTDVAITIAADKDNLTGAYTREAPAALINAVALLIVNADPEHVDVATTGVVDQEVAVGLKLSLPASIGDGGNGGGWVDEIALRWPRYYAAAAYLTAAPSSSTLVRVDVTNAANIPIAEASIALWSNSAKRFEHSRVVSSALVAGTTYDITLYDPIDTSILATNDVVSPDCEKMDDYGETIAGVFGALGPGEKAVLAGVYSDSLPRCLRRPLINDSWPSSLTSKDIGQLSTVHPEISHVTCVYPTLPSTPTVPATGGPNILVLGKLALYPL